MTKKLLFLATSVIATTAFAIDEPTTTSNLERKKSEDAGRSVQESQTSATERANKAEDANRRATNARSEEAREVDSGTPRPSATVDGSGAQQMKRGSGVDSSAD